MNKKRTNENFIIHGDIIYSKNENCLHCAPDSYLVVRDGICEGVFDEIPHWCDADVCEAHGELGYTVYEYPGKLIIPGMVDLHIHAPQFHNRGVGMDRKLLDWLDVYTFPEETKYATYWYDHQKAYEAFAEEMRLSPTSRAVIFGTSDPLSTASLATLMDKTGLISYIGLVAMNQNGADGLLVSPEQYGYGFQKMMNLKDNELSYRTSNIITPRFAVSCDEAMLQSLHHIAENTRLPVQTHLCESLGEIKTVKHLHPQYENYASVYRDNGLFGNYATAIMAHCVHCSEEEKQMLEEHPHVFVAHCPESNINLTSGVAPIAEYLKRGISVGLGTDVSAGSSENMFRQVMFAIQASKMLAHFTNNPQAQLSLAEAFYIATVGGGRFFGGVGSFEPGFAADILVVADPSPSETAHTDLVSRLERLMYLGDSNNLLAKFVDGVKLF